MNQQTPDDPSKPCTNAAARRTSKRRELLEVSDEPSIPASFVLANDKRKQKVIPRPDYGPCETSSVMSRLQSFLPELSAANETLLERLKTEGAETLDIEHLPEEGAAHIEMDLQCGVFDLKTSDAANKAARHVGSAAIPLQSSHKGADDEDEADLEDFISSDDDDSSDEDPGDVITQLKTKQTKKRSRIVEL